MMLGNLSSVQALLCNNTNLKRWSFDLTKIPSWYRDLRADEAVFSVYVIKLTFMVVLVKVQISPKISDKAFLKI